MVRSPEKFPLLSISAISLEEEVERLFSVRSKELLSVISDFDLTASSVS